MVKAQGESKKPVWDVIDTPPSNCLRGGRVDHGQAIEAVRLYPAAIDVKLQGVFHSREGSREGEECRAEYPWVALRSRSPE
jgi:hypothetical protein